MSTENKLYLFMGLNTRTQPKEHSLFRDWTGKKKGQ